MESGTAAAAAASRPQITVAVGGRMPMLLLGWLGVGGKSSSGSEGKGGNSSSGSEGKAMSVGSGPDSSCRLPQLMVKDGGPRVISSVG